MTLSPDEEKKKSDLVKQFGEDWELRALANTSRGNRTKILPKLYRNPLVLSPQKIIKTLSNSLKLNIKFK